MTRLHPLATMDSLAKPRHPFRAAFATPRFRVRGCGLWLSQGSQPEPVVLSPAIYRSPRKPAPAARSMLAPFRSELSPLLASSPGHLQVKTDAAGHIDKEDPLGASGHAPKVNFLPFACLWLRRP
ncbi:hypothetical protein F5144DRAFT_139028 [Chaetomium tenue]|uniref:Uncharacterized protein n=1 Tax=Chaetomium tenue TaxID=1854479 RepID=A0ACB7PKJ4_9PEZI|nr:hypothetical protein F5144DRAFT_139028 [Chaetomium globosum]